MNILTIEHLTKNFGTNKVIDDLTFSVPENSVFGFLGPNGAGKTTTMKMILGLIKPNHGKITVCGKPVNFGQTTTNKYIGYLPDVPQFYGYMKPYEYLKLCGEITGLDSKTIKSRSEELLALVGLEHINKKISQFSRGMKQRLGIAQALLHEPKLLICDEPTSALDPVGRREILDILRQVKGKTTVLFSTHILSDVERICDRIAVIHKGKIVLSGTLAEIKKQHKSEGLIIDFANLSDKDKFTAVPEIKPLLINSELSDYTLVIHTEDVDKAYHLVLKTLLNQNIIPAQVRLLEPSLESLFMEVVK